MCAAVLHVCSKANATFPTDIYMYSSPSLVYKKAPQAIQIQKEPFLCAHLNVTATILKGITTVDDGELVHQVTVLTFNEIDQLEKMQEDYDACVKCTQVYLN